MRKYLLLLCFALLVSGCAPAFLVAGSAGATYSIATGSVSDNVDARIPQVVDAFINIIKDKGGQILFASITEGKAKAEINNISYSLTTERLTENSTRFTISARKGYDLLPAQDEAIQIYSEMADRLK
jgi:hypothetical protein